MENRDALKEICINELENELELLCVSGVEDKLQEAVTDTIQKLMNAGIKVWMLTGDKLETAKCIAVSAGIKSRNHKFYEISKCQSQQEMQTHL